jgi:hypothetical protein
MKAQPKIHHYIPQFLLKNFSIEKKDHVYVFDKESKKSSKTNIRNIASENYFNRFEILGNNIPIEEFLGVFESMSAHILKKIINTESISLLSGKDKSILSYFFAVQFFRTKHNRESFFEMTKLLKQRFGIDESKIPALDEELLKNCAMRMIIEAPDFAVHFFNKDWFLIKPKNEQHLFIGDHPLVLDNPKDFFPYGNIGLAVNGINIYFPLTPNLALGMYCSTYKEEFTRGIELNKYLLNMNKEHEVQLIDFSKLSGALESLYYAMELGTPLLYSKNYTTHFNYLQIIYAERFIYSCNDDFELVHDIMSKIPSAQKGLRVIMN